jgi:hypothetical protein
MRDSELAERPAGWLQAAVRTGLVAGARFALQQNLRTFVTSLTGMRREPQFETTNWQDHC